MYFTNVIEFQGYRNLLAFSKEVLGVPEQALGWWNWLGKINFLTFYNPASLFCVGAEWCDQPSCQIWCDLSLEHGENEQVSAASC